MREMIKSVDNKKIKNYSKLLQKKYRRDQGMFIVEGYHMVEEALASGDVIEVITSNPDDEGTLVAPFLLKKLTSAITPQPIVAIVSKPKPKEMGDRVIALENIQDPGNVGTIIRTAVAFGFTDVIVQGVDVYSDKALRSSQGAIFKTNIIQAKDITQYFGDYEVVGAILDKTATTYDQYKPEKPLMLIVGNEGNGISSMVIEKLNEKVYIPIKFESLNVAIASGILMNQYKKKSS